MRPRVLWLVLIAAVPVGCGGDDEPVRKSNSGVRLPVAPQAIADACAKAVTSTAFPVLCPARWPPPGGTGPPRARPLERGRDVYLLDFENGFRSRSGHLFHLMLGGQARPFGRWPAGVDPGLRLPTRKVTIDGGRYVQQLPARPIGFARVHGTRATVLQAPPYPAGGIHGGHVVVLWSEAGRGYLVSVHGERLSRDALVAAALGLARSARR